MKKEKKEAEFIIEDITDTAPDLVINESDGVETKGASSDTDGVLPKRKKKKHKKKPDEAVTGAAEDKQEQDSKAAGSDTETKEALEEAAAEEKTEAAAETSDRTDEVTVKDREAGSDGDDKEKDTPEGEIVIDMKNIVKRYFIGQPNELEVLHGIDMQVRRGEFVAIVGQSGSGKSTLMNMIGALDRPTEGEYTLDGVDMFRAKDKDLSAIRCKKIGFVFQTYNLVARTSALKNVELPMLYGGIPITQRSRKAKELLEMVEMGERMRHQPDELSGGQKQRVAIARAMANDPAIILADEPTGALDSVTGRLIMDIFHKLHEEQGKTIILITHSPELAEECSRILTLKDGVIIKERKGSGRNAVH